MKGVGVGGGGGARSRGGIVVVVCCFCVTFKIISRHDQVRIIKFSSTSSLEIYNKNFFFYSRMNELFFLKVGYRVCVWVTTQAKTKKHIYCFN